MRPPVSYVDSALSETLSFIFQCKGIPLERVTGGDVAQFRFPGEARDFLLESTFSARLSYGVRTPPFAIACISSICAHVKDPVNITVRWIMETLKHPACTVGWVTRPCRSWLSPGKATRIYYGKNPKVTIQLYKNKTERHCFTTSFKACTRFLGRF